jgi:hypothetical protein
VKTVLERFWEKVRIAGEQDCWLWTGAVGRHGYGNFGMKAGHTVRAHRFSYELAKGSIPSGLVILHGCDTALCVNPAHLSVGTQRDNMRDMVTKGRALVGDKNPTRVNPSCRVRGEGHGMVRLQRSDVLEIRRRVGAGEIYRSIARDFNISTSYVSQIFHRKHWSHI